MFRLDILQNQWLLVAMLAGLAITLAIALAYLAIWRPRGLPVRPRGIPWVLVVTYLATAAFAVGYVLMMVYNPPTW